MSEDKNTSAIFAGLILRGKDLVPQEITDAIGIKPTKSFKRGDIRKDTQKWPHGYWELITKDAIQSSDLSAHLDWLVKQLASSKTELIDIVCKEDIEGEISCFWILPTDHETLLLTSDLLKKIAELGLNVTMDVYSP